MPEEVKESCKTLSEEKIKEIFEEKPVTAGNPFDPLKSSNLKDSSFEKFLKRLGIK